ncbi:hypothetical protein [Neolewinella litorea]|uniref:DUF4279 domain-containing protein n=1 Tax=Neolewinella litorea TaxID=2562452 RepID=A0A4S4NKQ8_9BACT|nr:hypothetical protein [Neolewinella litorea]THH40409.1 hypothetical protein E4021_06650 [Neolewinella litorea]
MRRIKINVGSLVMGRTLDRGLLSAVPEISDVGTTKDDDDPHHRLPWRARFQGYAAPPRSPYEKLHQHLVLLHERYPKLREAGVEKVQVYLTYSTDDPHLPTELSAEEIALLAGVNGSLSTTFDSSFTENSWIPFADSIEQEGDPETTP